MDTIIQSKEIRCPICDGRLIADVYEYETDTGVPLSSGFILMCETGYLEPIDCCEWSYETGIVLDEKAHTWMKEQILSGDLSVKQKKDCTCETDDNIGRDFKCTVCGGFIKAVF